MFPNRFPMERESPSPEPVVYSFIFYICQSQVKEPSYEMGGKHLVTIHGFSHGWKAHITRRYSLVPQGYCL